MFIIIASFHIYEEPSNMNLSCLLDKLIGFVLVMVVEEMSLCKLKYGDQWIETNEGCIGSKLFLHIILNSEFDSTSIFPFLHNVESDSIEVEPEIKERPFNHFCFLDSVLVINLGELLLVWMKPQRCKTQSIKLSVSAGKNVTLTFPFISIVSNFCQFCYSYSASVA